jgi:hypothetical protein
MMKIKKKKKRKCVEAQIGVRRKDRSCSYPVGCPEIYTIYTSNLECPSLKGLDGVCLLKISVHQACTGMQILTENN